MKLRILFILSVFSSVFLWQSCSNELDLNAEWTDLPIVYGFLDINNETHYIRIQKAFLDDETSALEIAQNSDSIYYDNIDVSLTVNDAQTYTLTKVNGEDEGLPKDEGAFANVPNILYKITQAEIGLEGCDEVTLTINRGDNSPPVTASTTIVGNSSGITDPGNDINGNARPLVIKQGVPENIRWRPDKNAYVYDLRLIFVYEEHPAGQPMQAEEFRLTYEVNDNIPVEIEEDKRACDRTDQLLAVGLGATNIPGIDAINFFNFLGVSIPVKDNFVRNFKNIEVVITGGSEEFVEIFDIQAANTGITSAQEIPVFTNISEGRGIFASRNQLVDVRSISAGTLDSLRNGSFTRDLNFD